MQTILFYLTAPLIRLFSALPLKALYFISDFFIYPVIYKLLGYRLTVVRQNLKNSFPEKDEASLRLIEKKFYHYLSDLFVETFFSFSIAKSELNERVVYKNMDLIYGLMKSHKGIVFSLGHYGNYEWMALSIPANTPWLMVGPYRRLNNLRFDKFFKDSRERFGSEIFHTYDTYKALDEILKRNVQFTLALVNDQNAPAERSYWGKFLNQDTAFFVGTEKLARQLNFPVVFLHINVTGRGRYEVTFDKITENPEGDPMGFIMQKHIEKLETDILKAPQYWLWSHKRWKFKKPEYLDSGFAKGAKIN